jgi:hypothetical protein
MQSARGEWKKALSAHEASKTLGEGAPLSATYVAIERSEFGTYPQGWNIDHYNCNQP